MFDKKVMIRLFCNKTITISALLAEAPCVETELRQLLAEKYGCRQAVPKD